MLRAAPSPVHARDRATSPALQRCFSAGRKVKRRLDHVDLLSKRDTNTLMLRDQALFTFGVLALLAIVALLFGRPRSFPLVHVALWPLNFFWLFYSFAVRRRWSLFLIDFCYVVNWLTWFFFSCVFFLGARAQPPSRDALFAVVFVSASGPILMAHIPWRVSLTFHKPDSMASVLTHTLAPLACYAYRWSNPSGGGSSTPHTPHMSPPFLFFAPLLLYAAWQAAYLMFTEVVIGPWLRHEPRQLSSLRWLVKTVPVDSPLTALARSMALVPRPDGRLDASETGTKVFFVVMQGAYTLASLLLGAAAFHSHALNALLLALVAAHAVFQGSAFYFRSFAAKYVQECAEKVRAAAAAASDAGSGVVLLDHGLEGDEGVHEPPSTTLRRGMGVSSSSITSSDDAMSPPLGHESRFSDLPEAPL